MVAMPATPARMITPINALCCFVAAIIGRNDSSLMQQYATCTGCNQITASTQFVVAIGILEILILQYCIHINGRGPIAKHAR
jgi:hypothetical protein